MMADTRGQLPLHVAATFGNADAAKLLLAAVPQAAMMADGNGRWPLHHRVPCREDATQVSASAAAEIVQLLLAASPQAAVAVENRSMLPLHHAVGFQGGDNGQS